jgi:hypothetical protein
MLSIHTRTISFSEHICPICLDLEITHYTKCNHGYCYICYNKINNCAICRMENCKKITCKDLFIAFILFIINILLYFFYITVVLFIIIFIFCVIYLYFVKI